MAEYILLRKVQTPTQAVTTDGVASGSVAVSSTLTAQPVDPTAFVGVWSEVQLGEGSLDGARRIITPAVGMYPNSTGVSFWKDDVFNRTDATGPNESSVYHFYPSIDLVGGEVLRASWTDVNGVFRESTYSVPNPAPVAPTASGDIRVISSAVGPLEAGAYPLWDTVGPTGPITRSFGSVSIDQDWLDANNGGSLLLENVQFSGRVNIEVDNLTIRNFRRYSGGGYGFFTDAFKARYSGIVFEDGEVTDAGDAFVIRNSTVRRVRIRNTGADAFKLFGNCTLESNFITDLGYEPGAHADGIQVRSGSNFVVRGNNFEMPYQSSYLNSICILFQAAEGSINNLLIEDNRINGGGFSMNLSDSDGNSTSNYTIRNNVWGRDHQYGPATVDTPITSRGDFVWTNNKYEDNDEAIVR